MEQFLLFISVFFGLGIFVSFFIVWTSQTQVRDGESEVYLGKLLGFVKPTKANVEEQLEPTSKILKENSKELCPYIMFKEDGTVKYIAINSYIETNIRIRKSIAHFPPAIVLDEPKYIKMFNNQQKKKRYAGYISAFLCAILCIVCLYAVF